MFCTKCGREIKEGYKFCVGCGDPVKADEGSVQSSKSTLEPQNVPIIDNISPLKLYMPSKASFLKYKFDIKDEWGNNKFFAESGAEGFSGYRMTMWDTHGNELVLVKQKREVTFMAVNFEAHIQGQFVTNMMQKATFSHYYFVLEQLGLKVEGDLINCEYKVVDGTGNILATISRKMLAFGDHYEIHIADSRNELIVLAAVFAVELLVVTLRHRRRR